MSETKQEPKCGTRYKHTKHGCNCALCLEAVERYNEERARKKKEMPRFALQPIVDRMTREQKESHSGLIKANAGKSLTIYKIDRLCCSLGFHPYEVYGDLWYEDIWNSDKRFRGT